MPSAINNARKHVEALRLALLTPSPEQIVRCLPGLEEAARCLAATERELPRAGPERLELPAELRALKNDLRAVNRLIERGAAYHQGWAKLLGLAAAGYTPTGDAAPIAASGSLSIRG